jgi:PAS domain S-box-containing protein
MDVQKYDIVRPDGRFEERWWKPANAPLVDDNGNVVAIIHHVEDITAEHRATEALRANEERFRQFGDASQDILWMRDAETLQWRYLTPAFETIYGLSRAEAMEGDNYRSWLDLVVPEDRDHADQSIARIRAGEHVTFDYRIRRLSDGAIRWLRNTDFPIRGAAGEVVLFGGVGHDFTGVRETERQLQTLMEGIPQLVWRSGDEGRWAWSSPQWQDFTGQSLEASLALGWLDAVHPDDREATLQAWEAARRHGMLDTEYRVHRASDGAYLWHHTRSVPIRDESGRIVEWLGTTTDVQQLKELQERQEVMVAELQHRTRNLIAVVRSIAGQTMAQTGPTEAFREEFNHRLEALARVQGLLSRSDEEPITIEALIRLELDALGAKPEPGRIDVEGPAVRVRHSVVQTLALALHELATNARKYGALSSETGRLDVRWHVYSDARGERLALKWEEVGGQPPKTGGDARRGYGRELIEQALPYSLNAKTSVEHDAAGLRCTIDMPLERNRSRRKAA